MKNRKFSCLAIASPSFSKHQQLVADAGLIAERVVVNKEGHKFDEEGLIQFLNEANADAAIIGTDPLSKKVVDQAKMLRAVGKYGVGCDNVDMEALIQKGVYFGWRGGVNRRSVSELAFGFMLGHKRNIFKSIDLMQRGKWNKNGGVQLSEKTIGIVGFGFIGTDLAKLLRPFGCKVLVCDILDKSEICLALGASQVSYHELLQRSDVISFHVPGGQSTENLFGLSEIKLVRKNALIINTSRGNIVNFEVVQRAVFENVISAYASDVFPFEPFESLKFKVESGFYFTPHIGGNAEEAILAMGRSAIAELTSFLESR